jgi:hypothetical protein
MPLLQHGERLTRQEFERRYEAMSQLKKAELLEGVVYLPSPKHRRLQAWHRAELLGWLGVYRASTIGVG